MNRTSENEPEEADKRHEEWRHGRDSLVTEEPSLSSTNTTVACHKSCRFLAGENMWSVLQLRDHLPMEDYKQSIVDWSLGFCFLEKEGPFPFDLFWAISGLRRVDPFGLPWWCQMFQYHRATRRDPACYPLSLPSRTEEDVNEKDDVDGPVK